MIVFALILLMIVGGSRLIASETDPPDSSRLIRPKAALLRSAIMPGWGQLYVHKPIKAVIYFSLEAYHVYNFSKYNNIYQYIEETKNRLGVDVWKDLSEDDKKAQVLAITGYAIKLDTWRPREMRNKYGWWCAAFYIANMLDALVDAHLYYFPAENIELSYTPETNGIGISLSWNLGR